MASHLADWSASGAPTLTSTYTEVLDILKLRDEELSRQFWHPTGSLTGANHVEGTVLWNGTNKHWQVLDNTSAWVKLATEYDIDVVTVKNHAPSNAAGTALAPTIPINNNTLNNGLVAEGLGSSTNNAAHFHNAANLGSGKLHNDRLNTSLGGVSITGTASKALKITHTADATNVWRYLTFGSSSTTTANQSMFVDGGLRYNPSVNRLSIIGTSANAISISTNAHIVSGLGSGGVAMTVNDGAGNANLTFNHVSMIPEQNGSSGRIHVNTDSTTDAAMAFQLKSDVTGGTSTGLTTTLQLTETDIKFLGNKVWHAGNDGSGSGLDADLFDGYGSGSFLRSNTDDTMTHTLTISNGSPKIKFHDNTTDADDFWVHVNSNNFYVLTDRDGNGTWEGDNPLRLRNANQDGAIYGSTIITESTVGIGTVTLDGNTVTGRTLTISDSGPSGGSNGDIWMEY